MDLSGYSSGATSSATSNPYSSYTMDKTSLQTPAEWDWAMNMYKNYANGAGNVKLPETWNVGSNTLTQMTETGMPTDINAWYQEQLPVWQQQNQDESMRLAELAGVGGTRWGTPLQRNIVDYATRSANELNAQAMGKQLEADEAARQRQIEAANQLLAYTKYKSDLARSNASARFAGIGEALNLATQKYYAPLTIAAALGSQGNSIYNQQSGQAEQITNPSWLQGAQGALASSPTQQYAPSFAENMLGLAGSTLPYTKWFGGGGSSIGTTPTPAGNNMRGIASQAWTGY